MKQVYIVNGNLDYDNLFISLGFKLTENIANASLVCFTGGEDVTPSLYGDKAHRYTYNSVERDAYETDVFNVCRKLGIPMVGICRGGQFLNVMSGGRMYQDVSGHTRSHDMVDLATGETIYVSSTHHQMMLPHYEGKIIATSNNGGYRERYDGGHLVRDVSNQDIEVVFYPTTRALCFQPHPEFDDDVFQRMRSYFAELINNYLEV